MHHLIGADFVQTKLKQCDIFLHVRIRTGDEQDDTDGDAGKRNKQGELVKKNFPDLTLITIDIFWHIFPSGSGNPSSPHPFQI